MSAGDTTAAAALRSGGARLRARALSAALEANPTMRDRHAEVVIQALLADLEAFHDRLVVAVSSADPHAMATFADLVAVRYRKRKIPMDDVISLCEGLRRAASSVVEPGAVATVDAAIARRSRSSSGTAAWPATRGSATPAGVPLQGA